VKVLFFSFIIIIIDQATKLFIKGFSVPSLGINVEGMYHGQQVDIIGDFLRLTFIENPGMAFGFDPGTDMKIWISLFSIVASIGLTIYLYNIRKEHFGTRIALSFILGGAIGNLIDRMFYGVIYGYAPLFYGKVVDFIDFDFFNISLLGRNYDRFPIFNIADSSVTIGVLLLLIFYNKMHKEPEPAAETQTGTNETVLADGGEEHEIATDSPAVDDNLKEKSQDNDEPDNGKEIPL